MEDEKAKSTDPVYKSNLENEIQQLEKEQKDLLDQRIFKLGLNKHGGYVPVTALRNYNDYTHVSQRDSKSLLLKTIKDLENGKNFNDDDVDIEEKKLIKKIYDQGNYTKKQILQNLVKLADKFGVSLRSKIPTTAPDVEEDDIKNAKASIKLYILSLLMFNNNSNKHISRVDLHQLISLRQIKTITPTPLELAKSILQAFNLPKSFYDFCKFKLK